MVLIVIYSGEGQLPKVVTLQAKITILSNFDAFKTSYFFFIILC